MTSPVYIFNATEAVDDAMGNLERRRNGTERYLLSVVLSSPSAAVSILRSIGANPTDLHQPDFAAMLDAVMSLKLPMTQNDVMMRVEEYLSSAGFLGDVPTADLRGRWSTPLWTRRGLELFADRFGSYVKARNKHYRRRAVEEIPRIWQRLGVYDIKMWEAARWLEQSRKILAEVA